MCCILTHLNVKKSTQVPELELILLKMYQLKTHNFTVTAQNTTL